MNSKRPRKNKTGDGSWIHGASFITALDCNIQPLNASVYGSGTDWDMLGRFMREVRPDLFIVEGLGYWAWSSYESKVAPSPDEARLDFVDRVAALCRKEKIRLGFMVESWQTVGDSRPFNENELSRWFRVDEDGKKDRLFFCPNGPYAKEYLLPYCYECMDRYEAAAFWFDHVRTRPCWCDYCEDAYRNEHGRKLPVPGEKNWRIRMELFTERSFVSALERTSDALHAYRPGIVLCWANALDFHTHRPVFRGDDWIASDEVNGSGARSVRYDAAYRAGLRRPAHLWVPDKLRKPLPRQRCPEELQCEAALLSAHGLGMTMYHFLSPDGHMGNELFESALTASRFLRKKAASCHGNILVPHAAILLSVAQNLRYQDRFQPNPPDPVTVHTFLAENHIPCELVADDLLLEHLYDYAMVVSGEIRLIARATARSLEDYVKKGGMIFLIGPAPLVADPLEATPDSPRLFDLECEVGDRIERHWADGRLTHLGCMCKTGEPGDVIWHRTENDGSKQEPLLMRITRGKGQIWWLLCTAVTEFGGPPYNIFHKDMEDDGKNSVDAVLASHNMGAKSLNSSNKKVTSSMVASKYSGLAGIDFDNRPFRENPERHPYCPHPHLRRLVGTAMQEALGEKWLLRSNAPPGVLFTVNRRGADLYVHAVNAVGMGDNGDNCPVIDNLPVLADIEFELHLKVNAQTVSAVSASENIEVVKTKSGCKVKIPRLACHVAVRFPDCAKKYLM